MSCHAWECCGYPWGERGRIDQLSWLWPRTWKKWCRWTFYSLVDIQSRCSTCCSCRAFTLNWIKLSITFGKLVVAQSWLLLSIMKVQGYSSFGFLFFIKSWKTSWFLSTRGKIIDYYLSCLMMYWIIYVPWKKSPDMHGFICKHWLLAGSKVFVWPIHQFAWTTISYFLFPLFSFCLLQFLFVPMYFLSP